MIAMRSEPELTRVTKGRSTPSIVPPTLLVIPAITWLLLRPM